VHWQTLTDAQILQLESEFRRENDRGLALVAASYLETQLRWFLEGYFSESLSARERERLFEGPAAPLASFASRVALARALALIGPLSEHDLAVVRKIRNAFAHRFARLSFADAEVAKLCASLRLPDVPLGGITLAKVEPRERFLQSVTCVFHWINGEMHHRSRCPAQPVVAL
jgi:hypothetical protein